MLCRCRIQRPAAIKGLFHEKPSRSHSGCGFKRFHRKSHLSRKPKAIKVKLCSCAMHNLGDILFAHCLLFVHLRSQGIFQLGLLVSENGPELAWCIYKVIWSLSVLSIDIISKITLIISLWNGKWFNISHPVISTVCVSLNCLIFHLDISLWNIIRHTVMSIKGDYLCYLLLLFKEWLCFNGQVCGITRGECCPHFSFISYQPGRQVSVMHSLGKGGSSLSAAPAVPLTLFPLHPTFVHCTLPTDDVKHWCKLRVGQR